MAGILYIVATPIGNLSDLTPRAVTTFTEADFIAAEDTRVTVKLLNYIGIKKPMISYFEHNLEERGRVIIERLNAGESCAMCSDAGVPAVSDPGEILVADALAAGIKVVPIPAASAAITALSVSGQSTGRFCFEGFLPMNKKQRKLRLLETQTEQRTMIFYEAPHKLRSSLEDMLESYGDRSMTICRELTKMHEEINKTTIAQAIAHYAENAPRGEFVLVIAGAEKPEEVAYTDIMAAEYAKELVKEGEKIMDACKKSAAKTGIAKSEIYRIVIRDGENK